MATVDAIVIGGGLAGAAFATRFASRGGRVLVLERSRGPTLRVCRDFLSGEALGLLAGLGVDAMALGAAPVTRMRFGTRRRSAAASLPFAAAGLSRLVLDEAMLARAAAAGAVIERGVTVSRLGIEDDGVVVAAGSRRLVAPMAVLATGKHNLRGHPRDPGRATGFKLSLALSAPARAALDSEVRLVLFDGGYIGISLIEGGMATLCWQMEDGALKRLGADWRGQVDALSGAAPVLGDLLAAAAPATTRPAAVSGLPFGYIRRRAIAPTVFGVGDQLAVIPAFTGDGTSIALASGIAAADAVLAGAPAAVFHAAFARRLRTQFRLARTMSALFQYGVARRVAVSTMGLLPTVAGRVAQATRLDLVPASEV